MMDFGKNYVRSWMHKDTVSHCLFLTPTHAEYALLATASIDGVIKFWQRRPPPEDKSSTDGHSLLLSRILKVHEAPLSVFQANGNYLISGDLDGRICVVDILALEVYCSFRVPGVPECALISSDNIHSGLGGNREGLYVALRDECKLLFLSFDGQLRKESSTPFPIIGLHFYQDATIWAFGNQQQIMLLRGEHMHLVECKDCEKLLNVTVGKKYIVLLNEQGILSVYKIRPKGDDIKLYRKYDLNFEADSDLMASAYASFNNVLFDNEEEDRILVATGRGIQMIDFRDNGSVIIAGQADADLRFVNISLLMAPLRLNVTGDLVYLSAEENPTAAKFSKLRPLLACTAFRRNRVYLFSPENSNDSNFLEQRDMQNEYEEEEGGEDRNGFPVLDKDWREYVGAWIRTSKGDLQVELYHETAPLAVQNFIHLARTGRYNNVPFHRVIPGFMVQTGDIDGRGGTSAWGRPFPDEQSTTSDHHRQHDQMGIMSMANAGRNDNGSQFFLLTTNDKCSWLDGKHTIFGKVIKGLDVLAILGKVETNRRDEPVQKIEMLQIELIKNKK